MWLFTIVDTVSGLAPNTGGNDGANLLPFTNADIRDFRPSVQVAVSLFCNKSAYPEDENCRSQLRWMGIDQATQMVTPTPSIIFDQGGYIILRRGSALLLMRFPVYQFRPGHADPLHIDLFVEGENLLRDGGSYRYDSAENCRDYFSGIEGHNSVQFDHEQPMPRLSRFLWGAWLHTKSVDPVKTDRRSTKAGASYETRSGAVHSRNLELTDNGLIVTDDLKGFQECAVLRWRLCPGDWVLEEGSLSNGRGKIKIAADVPIRRFEIVNGWESIYYGQKTTIPVLEVEVSDPGCIQTSYTW